MRFLGSLMLFILLSGFSQAQSSKVNVDSLNKAANIDEAWVGLEVDSAGKPYNIRIIKINNPDFSEKAIKIVQETKFPHSKTSGMRNMRVKIRSDEANK